MIRKVLTSKQKERDRLNKKQWYLNHKEEVDAKSKQHYQDHKEEAKVYQKQWYQDHKEEMKVYRKQYNLNYKKQIKYARLRRNYGIIPEDYDLLYNKQHGKCAICHIHATQLKKALSVDHDHKTGKIRGLLCNKCNSVLGYVKEDFIILQNAIKYLTK